MGGKWQKYSKANSPGALPPARAAGPRSLAGAAGRREQEEETEEEREPGCGRKAGPPKGDGSGRTGCGAEEN